MKAPRLETRSLHGVAGMTESDYCPRPHMAIRLS